jgi:hypothetical protein
MRSLASLWQPRRALQETHAEYLRPKGPDGVGYRLSVSKARLTDLGIALTRCINTKTSLGRPHCSRDAAKELKAPTSQFE